MLQEEDQTAKIKIKLQHQIYGVVNSKQDRVVKESQLDFQKNYPKNIFIPMIEYLAQIGLKQEYERAVGSREEFEGKNVVSLSLIHKLMGADWFRENVQTRVLISNISNKILMNSKIKKKLFHLFVVKSLFEVFDEDLKEFKKRISKLASAISELTYIEDELFEYPSSILYLLRLFYKLICPDHIHLQFNPQSDNDLPTPSQNNLDYPNPNPLKKNTSQSLELEGSSHQNIQNPKQGSKEEYKHYIRKIINHFNTQLTHKDLSQKFTLVQTAILSRQKQIIEKYKLPWDVPAWSVFIQKVVYRCFQCYKKSGKITHAMMNEWINNFKESVTSTKGIRNKTEFQALKSFKKEIPYLFKPLILQYFPNQY